MNVSECDQAYFSEDMGLKYCFILLFAITRSYATTFRIGVIVNNDTSTKDLPSLVAVNHQFDYRAEITSDVPRSNLSDYMAEIIWEPLSNWSLFHIVQAGYSLRTNGAVAIFIVITQRLNIHLTLDWLIPIIGLGSLRQAGETDKEDNCQLVTSKNKEPADDKLTGKQELYSDILMSLLIKLERSNAVFIYDHETEFISTGISEKIRTSGIFLTMYKIDESFNDEKINQFLGYIYNISTSKMTIITVCGSTMMRRFMTQANLFDDRTPRETSMNFISRWLLFHINDGPLEDVTFFSNLNNVAIVNLPSNTISLDVPKYMTLHYILHNIDTRSTTSEKVMGDYSLFALQEEIYNVSRQARKSYVDSIRFPIRTLMFYKVGRQWATIGETSLNGEVKLHSPFFPNQNFGFNEKTFVVSTLEYFPFEYIQNGTWKGFCIELLEELSRKLNFSYYLTSPSDGEWGRLVDKTSWTGMVGQLQRKEVDMTFAPLIITGMREDVMDFTLGFFYEQTVILMKKLDPSETQWLRLIKPLRWEVILLTGCLVPVISLLLFAIEKVNPFYTYRLNRRSLHDVFWYIYGCVFNQGGKHLPRSQTGRTVICCWWLFCMMLSAIYCGNLIAILTIKKEKLPFDSLAEMVQQTDYEWGTLGGTFWVTWFQYGTTPVLKSIWSGIVASNHSDPRILSGKVSTHIEKLREGRYAYIAERSQVEIIAADDCDLHIAKEEFLPLQYGIGLPDNSPYTKLFSDVILGIHESGLMQIWKQKYWPKKSFCAESLITEAKPIQWNDIQMAFILSGIGLILGGVFLAAEFIFRKCKIRQTTSSGQQSMQRSLSMKSIS